MRYVCFEQISNGQKTPRIIGIGTETTLEAAVSEVPPGTAYQVLDEEAKQAFWDAYHPAVVHARRIDELMAKLDQIDRQSIRPLRAIAKGMGTVFDRQRLEELEIEAEKIREELAGL